MDTSGANKIMENKDTVDDLSLSSWYLYEWSPFCDKMEWIQRAFQNKALKENKTHLRDIISGNLKDCSILEFIKYFEEGALCFSKMASKRLPTQYNSYNFYTDDSSINVSFSAGKATIYLDSISATEFAAIRDFCLKHILEEKDARKSSIYMLGSGKNGIELMYVGEGGCPLVRTNYSEEVLSFYDYIITQYRSATPKGRISILQGSPGTGKSYLIRAMLEDLTNCIFVVVPSEYVGELATPSFIPALLKIREEIIDSHRWDDHDECEEEEETIINRPIVLILEDADKCLVPRGADNMNSIGAVLNFSDGILGSVLDVRIVATTNARMDEIDSAIMRPGRLCSNIHVDKLDRLRANDVYHRIIGSEDKDLPDDTSFSLAEIYDIALGNTQTQKKETKMGF